MVLTSLAMSLFLPPIAFQKTDQSTVDRCHLTGCHGCSDLLGVADRLLSSADQMLYAPTPRSDAKLLKVYGILANRLKYNDLSYQIKKYVQFAITEHCAELPLLPILPVRLSSLGIIDD